MRLTLQQLRAETRPEALVALVRARFSEQRAVLGAAVLPPEIERARARIDASLEGSEELEPSEALAAAERGAGSAVELMRDFPEAVRLGDAAQQLLRHTFGSLIAQRVSVWRERELRARESADAPSQLLAETREPLGAFLANAVEDSRAFAREKFGDAPEVELESLADERAAAGDRSDAAKGESPGESAGDSAPRLLLPQYVSFAAIELLKNAMGAHVRRVGPERLDDLPAVKALEKLKSLPPPTPPPRLQSVPNLPRSDSICLDLLPGVVSRHALLSLLRRAAAQVRLRCGESGGWGFVSVRDSGGGLLARGGATRALQFLATTNPPREANYTYSRNFGRRLRCLESSSKASPRRRTVSESSPKHLQTVSEESAEVSRKSHNSEAPASHASECLSMKRG